MYVPAVRFIVIDLLPFANVRRRGDVRARSCPSERSRCGGTADGLLKSIVTFPAFADRVIVLNISAPVLAATRCSVVALPDGAAAALVELELIEPELIEPELIVLELVVAGAELAAAPLVEPALELDELLPQAAIARAANGTASKGSLLRMGPPIGGVLIVEPRKATQHVSGITYTHIAAR